MLFHVFNVGFETIKTFPAPDLFIWPTRIFARVPSAGTASSQVLPPLYCTDSAWDPFFRWRKSLPHGLHDGQYSLGQPAGPWAGSELF
jgi:hypothetical protein